MPEGVTDPNFKPLPGRLGNLTVTQQHVLEKLKKELQDEGHFVPERMDDATLLRWVNQIHAFGAAVYLGMIDFCGLEDSI
jgi:hypothetical protein